VDRVEPRSQFDFWLGEWELTWPAGQMGGVEGEQGRGTNSISRLYDGMVIEENFALADRSFEGHSVSVYDESTGRWRQTWVDSAGGYIALSGGLEDGVMVLRTEPTPEGRVNRMVFREVTADSLMWDWQRSTDGVVWSDLWNISYRRKV
jgi:hypothetical protein